jgi:hypothetical protein
MSSKIIIMPFYTPCSYPLNKNNLQNELHELQRNIHVTSLHFCGEILLIIYIPLYRKIVVTTKFYFLIYFLTAFPVSYHYFIISF